MNRRLAAVAMMTLASAVALPAQAASSRIWVSGHGVDQAGCGAPTTPCRSLQFAHDNIASGGEIDILDPAGYGSLTITKAVSIVNDGVGTAGLQAPTANGVLIDAGGADAVYLRGLTIDGATAQGSNHDGVAMFTTLARLTMVDCVVRRFLIGVLVQPRAGVTKVLIRNSVVEENDQGIVIHGETTGVDLALLDHVTILANSSQGILVDGQFTQGEVAATLSHVLASGNGAGIQVDSFDPVGVNNTAVVIDHAKLFANGQGLHVGNLGVAHLYGSSISENGVGVGVAGGAVFSGGDNHIDGNVTDLSATLQSEPPQ